MESLVETMTKAVEHAGSFLGDKTKWRKNPKVKNRRSKPAWEGNTQK